MLPIKENKTPIEKAMLASFQSASVEQNIKNFVMDLEKTLAEMILKMIEPAYKQKLNSSIFVEPSKDNLLMNITIKSGKNVHIQVFENTGYRPDQFNKGNDSNLLLLKKIQEEQTEPLYEFKTEIYEKDRVLKHTKPAVKINMESMTLKEKEHFVNFMKYTILGIKTERKKEEPLKLNLV